MLRHRVHHPPPLARALSTGSGFSVAVFSLSLAAGAFTSFKLIYPAAPLFPAAIFEADIATTIILGAVASIPVFAIGMIWAYYLGRRFKENLDDVHVDVPTSYDDLGEKFSELPSLWASLSSLMLPILLIVVRSILNRMPGEANALRTLFDFIGNPVIALPVGVGLALILARDKPPQEVNGWISSGISRSASILVIVGAGGVLGKILQETGIGTFLGNSVLGLGIPPLVVVFLISALIKTGQGSSMVTMVTAPAIIYPILPTLGLSPALATMAVCAGAMVCININDSFFWVVTGFSGMDIASGYKTITAMSILMGLVALLAIAVFGPLVIA